MNENPKPKSVQVEFGEFNYPIIKSFQLQRPSENPKISFFETLLKRRTNDSFKGISIAKLSQLLFYTAKTIEVRNSEHRIYSMRPTPSAGGIHPIDLITAELEDSDSTLNYYDPFAHSLNKLNIPSEETTNFIGHIKQIKPLAKKSTLIWMVAHEYRTSSKYDNPSSLVWRDAGCLLYCIALVCEALEVNCCPIGSLGEPYISNMFKKYGEVYGAGGCLVG